MKVLHVISDENIGGAGVLLTNLLRHFDPARVQSVVAMPRGSALQARVLATDIPIRFLAHRVDRLSARSVREIGDLVRRERVDLIHANAALNARIAGRANGVHVVHTRHCCFPPDGIWRIDPVRRLGGRWNAALSDRVVATAEAVVEDLRLFGVPREKIEVILNGSDPVREVDAVELKATRCRFGIGEGDFVVGICARLEPCKGHETFLRAAKEVLDRSGGRDFRFLIVGDGSRREALVSLAQTLGIADFVFFTGFLHDVAPIYRLMNLNVNCSSGTETSCLAISEGMSAGVPAIVSDYGGNRAMIGDSLAGRVCPTGDVDALADAILSVAANPELEARMRAAARERYESCYTAERMTERLTLLYESLTGR